MKNTSPEPARPSAQPIDGALVASIGAGDLTGLGELFDRHSDDVRRLLARLGIPSGDLDDLVQQTFLDVPRAAARFRPGAPVKPWLFGLAAMLARRHRRAAIQMVARLRKWTLEWTVEGPPTPAEALELSNEAKRAQRALETLSRKKREAFVLVALEEMTGEEAAAVLGVPVATVWTRLHHARLELKSALMVET
jgi:RNA polymerase sigma-70 factor (ECF subfamily)